MTTTSSTTVPASNGARTTTTAAAAGTSSSSTQPSSSSSSKQRLEHRFPVNSSWELTIDPETPPVSGRIYCTDELSQTVVLQTALAHTTLAAEMRIIHVNSITKAQPKPNEEDSSSSAAAVPPLAAQQLPKVQKKMLEEREKRAIRMAEESLRHINQKASPEGQLVFDKLLKACNEVVWKGESILVLNHVQVDPPYGPEQCKIVGRSATGKKALDHGSVERIKKIVAAATVNTTTNAS